MCGVTIMNQLKVNIKGRGHTPAPGGGKKSFCPPAQKFPLFSSTNQSICDFNSGNETLDQRGHFPLLKPKIHRAVSEESGFEIENDEMMYTKSGVLYCNYLGLFAGVCPCSLKEV